MDQEIKDIKIRLESIEKKIDKILESILKMDNHVDFVEDVYDTIRHPISFICNKITGSEPLPKKSKLIKN